MLLIYFSSHILDAVNNIAQEENFWIVDVTKLIPNDWFIKARVAEAILHFMLSGRFKKETPASIQRYLGLSTSLLRNANPDIAACQWPFKGITHAPTGFIIEDMDFLRSRLKLRFQTDKEILCNKFVEARRKFILERDASGLPTRSEANARTVINLAVEVILFFQLEGHTRNQLSPEHTYSYKRNTANSIIHVSAERLLDVLLKPTGRRDTKFRSLSEIVNKLSVELGGCLDVKKEMVSRIYELIEDSGYPFRVTVLNTDYVTVVRDSYFPLIENISKAWVLSLVDMNVGRYPSVAGGNVSRLVKTFFDYGNVNRATRFNMVNCARIIQGIFDNNEITARNPSPLKATLLATWRNDCIGENKRNRISVKNYSQCIAFVFFKCIIFNTFERGRLEK